ncbi:MAG: hypothetical protein IPN92_20995 [Chromatiaceae bacterium]|jgi:hypothetical protein|nr:hypothetical protein [Chromatiaceae bacterium]
MAGQAQLRCAALNIVLILPWWPTDVSRTLSARNVSELERADKRALAVPTTLTADDYSLGYTLRTTRHRDASFGGINVTEHIADLERVSRSKAPVQLLLGDNAEGLFRVEAPTLTILEWDGNTDRPSVVDVSLTLKRASDAEVNVGLVKRIKGRGRGFGATR